MKNHLHPLSRLALVAVSFSLLAACSTPSVNSAAPTDTAAVAQTNVQSLESVSIGKVPGYALKPASQKVGLTGQMKIPANLILGDAELSQLTAPPQGLTAPPQGLTAPPQGLTAPPLGVLPAQSIFGIRSFKSEALSTTFWVEFFRDNFKLRVSDQAQQVQEATINQTVIQFINGKPFFVASYVLPELQPNASYNLEAEHPLLNLESRLETGNAGQTVAADLDLGSTTVKLVKAEAERQNKQVNLAYLGTHIQTLEATVADALQKRFKSQSEQSVIDNAVRDFVRTLPAYVAPNAIQIQESVTTVKVGQPVAFSARTTFADNSETGAAQWSSSAGDVASVQADGILVGHKVGQVEIAARALDDASLSDTIIVNIVP